MKITSQSSDQMVLQDGGIAGGVFGGIVAVVLSAYWVYYLFTTPGQSAQTAWIPGIIALVGLIMIFTVSSITVSIDKAQGQIVFRRKRILGTSRQAQNISDAVRVELRRGSYRQPSSQKGFSMNGGRQVLESQTIVLFKDGTEMPLENKKDRSAGGSVIGAGVMMAGEGKEISLSQQVATFLGIPFEEMGTTGESVPFS